MKKNDIDKDINSLKEDFRNRSIIDAFEKVESSADELLHKYLKHCVNLDKFIETVEKEKGNLNRSEFKNVGCYIKGLRSLYDANISFDEFFGLGHVEKKYKELENYFSTNVPF